MFNVNQSLIRYWDKEFPTLKLKKSRNGNRRFTKEDIEELVRIYVLVKDRGFTIEGARNELKNKSAEIKDQSDLNGLLVDLKNLKRGLLKMKDNL